MAWAPKYEVLSCMKLGCAEHDKLAEISKAQSERIKELEAIIKSFADAPQCMHVPNWVVIKCENALKGGE